MEDANAGRRSELEIWGGIECTVNRVGDLYFDQCSLSGHRQRLEDLARFAELGLSKIRYPVLWEKTAPDSLDDCDWRWTDSRLNEIRRFGMTPIAGLLHHGSGPQYTSLLDPRFPQLLAAYAAKVAQRYPWLEWYTPINEPLTTARFSCLYGIWHPHRKSDESFCRALFHQAKGTILAMSEIRRINPSAKLVQTDDLGRIQATPPLRYQAEFENERRWLAFDMLLGKLDELHPLFDFVVAEGRLTLRELAWLRENACPPDIIGINHYPLSNRFLDHRRELYPEAHPRAFHGGNGRDAYVDVGAMDTGQAIPTLPYELLAEVWERYRRPFAVTEAHFAGDRESQMRWLDEIWSATRRLRSEGADARAVTAWSLLGAFEWNSLCTLRSPAPQER